MTTYTIHPLTLSENLLINDSIIGAELFGSNKKKEEMTANKHSIPENKQRQQYIQKVCPLIEQLKSDYNYVDKILEKIDPSDDIYRSDIISFMEESTREIPIYKLNTEKIDKNISSNEKHDLRMDVNSQYKKFEAAINKHIMKIGLRIQLAYEDYEDNVYTIDLRIMSDKEKNAIGQESLSFEQSFTNYFTDNNLNMQDPAEQPPMQPKQLVGLEPTGYCPVFIEQLNTGGHKFTVYIRGPIQDMHHYIMLLEALNTATQNDIIEIYIDSAGGMVTTGASIASAMTTCHGKVITIACGLCASAASLIWSAGHETLIWDYAVFMYHMSSHADMGNTARIAKRATEMVTYVKSCLLTEAVKKGHITQDELDTLCDTFEDKWITADEMKKRIGVSQ